MAILTPKYNAALPSGFTSGTLEIRYPSGVYVDSAGRASQAYYKATIQSNGTLINPQTGQALTIIGAGSGDPASQAIQVVVTLNVGALPSPNRFTRSIPNVFTSGSDLNIFTPNYNAPTVISPNDAVANAIAATGSASAATSAANTAAAAANAATANIGPTLAAAAAQAVSGVQGQVTAALAPVAPALADIAQTQTTLSNLANLKQSVSVAAVPSAAGLYLITGSTDGGQIHERLTTGGPLTRRPDLRPSTPPPCPWCTHGSTACAAAAATTPPRFRPRLMPRPRSTEVPWCNSRPNPSCSWVGWTCRAALASWAHCPA